MADNSEYFCRRARMEMEMARQATDPQSRVVHYTLASYYFERADFGATPSEPMRIVPRIPK